MAMAISDLERLLVTSQNYSSTADLTDAERTSRIKTTVMEAGLDLRTRYPILKHQDAIGAAILATALAGMLGCGVLFYLGLLPWWLCIPLSAFFASFTHELEHDLIHLMYFRNRPRIHAAMMWLVWLARPSTISPFTRRRMHLHHHKHSGTASDLEEQAITNGVDWGFKRLLMMGDQMLAIYLRPQRMRALVRDYIKAQKPASAEETRALIREQINGYRPLGLVYYLLWHSFIAYHVLSLASSALGHGIAWPHLVVSSMHVIDFLAVVWLAPNALRMFCLHFVSSNMHYFGDVEDQNVMQQCQVWNAWWLAPLHLFCFNFGSTHAIHHFVVKEPFYIRQMTARKAHAVMREMGVRFNDFGTFSRANRFGPRTVASLA